MMLKEGEKTNFCVLFDEENSADVMLISIVPFTEAVWAGMVARARDRGDVLDEMQDNEPEEYGRLSQEERDAYEGGLGALLCWMYRSDRIRIVPYAEVNFGVEVPS
jgi:hypothetical protein